MAYVSNDPVNKIDPEGKGPILVGICSAYYGYQITAATLAGNALQAQATSLNAIIAQESDEINSQLLKSCPGPGLSVLQDQLAANQAQALSLQAQIAKNSQSITSDIKSLAECASLWLIPD